MMSDESGFKLPRDDVEVPFFLVKSFEKNPRFLGFGKVEDGVGGSRLPGATSLCDRDRGTVNEEERVMGLFSVHKIMLESGTNGSHMSVIIFFLTFWWEGW